MKWRPSKAQKKAFAERMKDPEQAKAYEQRKLNRMEKRRNTSRFDYETAGGFFVPTRLQYEQCISHYDDMNKEQKQAANAVISGFTCNEKIHHDSIHIVNEFLRNQLL